MNLDMMKDKWTAQDAALADGLRAELKNVVRAEFDRREQVGKTKSAFRRITRRVLMDQGVSAFGLVLNGFFIGNHLGEWKFLVPAIVLHIALLALIVADAFQHEAISRIDFDGPIIEVQTRAERLGILRIRITQAVWLFLPLLWLPLAIVGLKGLFGIDAYRAFGAAFWIANGSFGLLWIPFALWAAKRFGDRFAASPVGRRIIADITGEALADAKRQLRDLADASR